MVEYKYKQLNIYFTYNFVVWDLTGNGNDNVSSVFSTFLQHFLKAIFVLFISGEHLVAWVDLKTKSKQLARMALEHSRNLCIGSKLYFSQQSVACFAAYFTSRFYFSSQFFSNIYSRFFVWVVGAKGRGFKCDVDTFLWFLWGPFLPRTQRRLRLKPSLMVPIYHTFRAIF